MDRISKGRLAYIPSEIHLKLELFRELNFY